MSLRIYSPADLPVERWAELTGNSIYSSPGFAGVWKTIKGTPVFLISENQKEIEAGMAGVIFGGNRFKRFQSMPDGFYGGPFFMEGLAEERQRVFTTEFNSWIKSEKIIRADIHGLDREFVLSDFDRHEMTIHVLELKDDSYAPPRKEVRKQVRAAKRREGTLVDFREEGDLDRFYDVVIETEQRHGGKPRYPKEFFKELLNLAKNDDRVLWPAVYADSKLAAARICFVDPPYLFMWQAYSRKEFTLLKPEYLLIDHIINYALENGIKYVNFGYTPPEAEMLTFFKERWGAHEKIIKRYTYFSRFGRLLYRWR